MGGKAPKFAHSDVVVCWNPFASGEVVVTRGARFHGDDPIVLAHPANFTADRFGVLPDWRWYHGDTPGRCSEE